MKTKVGILTCANMAEHGKCAASGCMHALNHNLDSFAEYAEKDGVELLGISLCSGCPTALAPERITKNLTTLIAMGMEKLHLSSCMLGVCPFKKKYQTAINEAFPNLEIIAGTHTLPPEEAAVFMDGMKGILTEEHRTVLDFVKAPE